ncbi:MAG TPA: MFS transporter [Streptosporangiaceae bacterium]|nr:MFS transporter [Streptosporangiaceae bacterium]
MEQPADQPSPRLVWLLSAGHTVDDLYQGAVPALIPFFVAARHWDYAAASGITVAATLLSSVVQPVFGVLTDRLRLPWLVPLGMSVAGAGVGLSGLGHSYVLTWLAIALSGLGVAAYHPESARLARAVARGSHVAMSWFSVGGNLGFALAPLIVAAMLGALGTGGTLPLAIPALICAVITLRALRGAAWANTGATARRVRDGSDEWGQFLKLTVAVVARSVVTFGLGTFLALYVEQRLHAGTAVGETALVVFYGVGALGTIVGGRLAERIGRVRLVRVSYLLGIPALVALWAAPGAAIFVAIIATAIVFYVPFSLHVTLGQDYLPSRFGTASGVTLGLAVSVGGLAAPVLGVIADHVGLRAAMAALIVMPVVATIAGLRLREPRSAGGARPAPVLAPAATSASASPSPSPSGS